MKDFNLSIPDLAALLTTFAMHLWLHRMLQQDMVSGRISAAAWRKLRWLAPLSGLLSASGLLLQVRMVWSVIPPGDWFTWSRGASIIWAIIATGTIIAYTFSRLLAARLHPTKVASVGAPAAAGSPQATALDSPVQLAAASFATSKSDSAPARSSPELYADAPNSPADSLPPARRTFLKATQGALLCGPAAVTAFGVLVGRHDLEPREVEIPIAGLPKDLEGLRIAQLSDIHLSAFVPRELLDRAVAMANEFRPHLHVVTGDLVTREGDPLDSCLAGLKALRSDAGTFGCMGNHERYAEAEDYVEAWGRRNGMPFLRHQQTLLRFGQAQINLAGVDYQKMHGEYLVGAQNLLRDDATNLLLSHNPDVFPVAAQQGWDLTLAGHTHGGQITVEYLDRYLNVVRFLTPFVSGHYALGKSQLYVTRGVGTVGVPARVGAMPEVTLLRLRKA